MAPRIFAVLAAILLVGSVAVASVLPANITLAQTLHLLNAASPANWQRAITGGLGHGFWTDVMVPVLDRPVWMMPVCLGLICAGGAVSAMTLASPRARQKRS